mmetsp:Transcript_31493/g.104373  ORF Transcript_31493/g.104373 Transcript_31493/m.104373 type:complete len:771 (-) Transcript_31493:79-2391(-)
MARAAMYGDIMELLAPAAAKALTAVELAIEETPAIQVQLTGASNVFQSIAGGAGVAPGDEVDRRAADALASVDALVQEHAGLALKEVQRRAQDVLMLACTRFMDKAALEDKGIPLEVRERLNEACQKDVLLDHSDLWSRLGNAKYHLFTHGKKWGLRRNRANRRQRHRAVGAAEAPAAAGAGAVEVEVDVGASDEDPAPEPVAERAAEGGRASTPVPSETEPEHEALPQREVYEEEADSSEQAEGLEYLLRVPLSIGGAFSGASAFARAQVHEVLQEIEKECVTLPIDVDVCFLEVTPMLVDWLPDIRAQTLVRQWVDLFKQAPRRIFSDEILFRLLLSKVVGVVKNFSLDEDIVRHCCVALGSMVDAMPALADDVCIALVNIMELFPGSLVVQDVCVAKLGKNVCWASEMVLGLDMSQDRPVLKPESQSRMLAAVHIAVDRFGPEVAGSSQDDFGPGKIQKNAFRVYSRLCRLPEVIKAFDVDMNLAEFVLSEVFTAMERGLLSWCWSDTDDSGIDSSLKEHHRRVLLQLAQQLSDTHLCGRHKEDLRSAVTKWIDCPMNYQRRQQRMVFAGVFLNSGEVVASVLFKALDSGVEMRTMRTDGAAFEEELITSALRALIELKCLEVLEADLVNEVLLRIRDDRFRPKTHFCHAAYVGTLGMLAASAAAVAAPPFDELTGVVHEVLHMAKYWFNEKETESIIFESLWALNKLLTAYIRFEPGLACECRQLATDVCKHETYSSWVMDNGCTTSDGANAFREAEKLLKKLQGQ